MTSLFGLPPGVEFVLALLIGAAIGHFVLIPLTRRWWP